MNKKIKIKQQIEEARKALNNGLLQNISNEDKINKDVLNISRKLDKLILNYIKEEISHK